MIRFLFTYRQGGRTFSTPIGAANEREARAVFKHQFPGCYIESVKAL